MRSYCTAQGNISNLLGKNMMEGSMSKRIYIYMYIYTYIHTHTHTYIYIWDTIQKLAQHCKPKCLGPKKTKIIKNGKNSLQKNISCLLILLKPEMIIVIAESIKI